MALGISALKLWCIWNSWRHVKFCNGFFLFENKLSKSLNQVLEGIIFYLLTGVYRSSELRGFVKLLKIGHIVGIWKPIFQNYSKFCLVIFSSINILFLKSVTVVECAAVHICDWISRNIFLCEIWFTCTLSVIDFDLFTFFSPLQWGDFFLSTQKSVISRIFFQARNCLCHTVMYVLMCM